jgi:Flp pilus assembly protein TadD
MIIQIVVIIVVLILLYLLLRHWPETEIASAKRQPDWSGAHVAVQSTSKSSLLSRIWLVFLSWFKNAWLWLESLFSDDKKRAAGPTKKQPKSDEFSEFIGVQERTVSKTLSWHKPDTRADRVGREKRLPGPLSPLRASKAIPTQTPPTEPVKKGGLNDWIGRLNRSAKPVEPAAVQSEAEMFLARAETAKRNNNFTEAEKMLVKAATKEPRNARVYAKLGLLYLEQGENWKEAEESFQQALKFDANNGFIHNNLGLVLYSQDRFSAAAKEFEAACRLDDSVASRHANLGLCWLSLRQYVKAEQEFKRAARLDAKNPEYEDLLKEAAEKRRTHRSN